MNNKFLLSVLAFLTLCSSLQGQEKLSQKISDFKELHTNYVSRPDFPVEYELYELNFNQLNSSLRTAPERSSGIESNTYIDLPTVHNGILSFKIFEASNFDSDLQRQYPSISSYVGIAKEYPGIVARIALDSRGINVYYTAVGQSSSFLEPVTTDATIYCLYEKTATNAGDFECSTPHNSSEFNPMSKTNTAQTTFSNQANLTTFRLAMSCDGEYATYHGGTQASVLAAMNTTLTRVNGVYEKDIAMHLELIASTTDVFYYNSSTDPYGGSGTLNNQLQATLSSVIGASNYDIGHLVSANGGGGNAGCIGCVCNNSNKGSAYTASGSPVGDTFDIDYVAHELGHQLGANHTFSNNNEGTGVNMEVGSGVTIMGYAGITGQDTHNNSIDIFHAASIQQIQNNIATKTCQTNTAIGFAAPVVSAGQNYSIPKLTPFLLEGTASTNSGGTLSYVWEQFDNGTFAVTGSNSVASPNKTTGPNWVNYNVSNELSRYFPKKSTVLTNSITTAGVEVTAEALSNVSRTLNFRFTARDNAIGVGLTNFDNTTITVDSSKGPLNITSQNTSSTSWLFNSSQTVTWTVNNTNTIPGGGSVDILLSTDGGETFDVVLASNIPNNGSATVTTPTTLSDECRLMVKASNNVFFNVNTTEFSIDQVASEILIDNFGFKIYPNPSKGQFNIELNTFTDTKTSVTVFDVQGRVVYLENIAQGANQLAVSLENTASGVYFVKINNGATSVTEKLIIE